MTTPSGLTEQQQGRGPTLAEELAAIRDRKTGDSAGEDYDYLMDPRSQSVLDDAIALLSAYDQQAEALERADELASAVAELPGRTPGAVYTYVRGDELLALHRAASAYRSTRTGGER